MHMLFIVPPAISSIMQQICTARGIASSSCTGLQDAADSGAHDGRRAWEIVSSDFSSLYIYIYIYMYIIIIYPQGII